MTVHATIPGGQARNGLAPAKPYVYNGTGRDELTGQLSDYALKPYQVSYERWIPPMPRGSNAPRRGKCPTCGYGLRSRNHRVLCGAR